MNYLVKGDILSLRSLAAVFSDVCENQGVHVNPSRSILLLLAFIDKAKEKGLFIPYEGPKK